MAEALLFIDIDGVLNGHQQHANGYCGTDPACVARLNRILAEVPEAQVVLSSSWRYLLHNGSMTLTGLENLLLTHGLNIHGRLRGITACDETLWGPNTPDQMKAELGPLVRAQQIELYVRMHRPERWCVLDDLALPNAWGGRLILTDGTKGLEDHHVAAVLEWLGGERADG